MSTVKKCIMLSLTVGFVLSYGRHAVAQTGPVQFTVTAAALIGTVTCPDGTTIPLSPVDPSTTNGTGSNEATLSSATVNACGKAIYQANNIDDKTNASDTTSLDDANGENDASKMSLLGGVVTGDTEKAPANCTAESSANIQCSGTGTFKNLVIDGSPIAAGNYAGGTTFDIVQVEIPSSSCPAGVELVAGQLMLADSRINNNDSTHSRIEVDWLRFTGKSVCVPTGAITKYDIRDEVSTQVNGLGAGLIRMFFHDCFVSGCD